MTHIQVTIPSVLDSHIFHFCHITHIAILQVAALVKISGRLQLNMAHNSVLWFVVGCIEIKLCILIFSFL